MSTVERFRTLVGRGRVALTEQDLVPGLRRLVGDLVRVEVIDRSMVIAAQALLALVPLLIVLGAFLPTELGQLALQRFEAATGLDPDSTALARRSVTPDQVRTETGVAGLLLTVFSARSFARAVQRMFERVWALPHVGGVRGNGRCFGWLAGWLVLLPLIALVSGALGRVLPFGSGVPLLSMVLATLVWWWSAHTLLVGRVPWVRLAPGAAIVGVVTVTYSSASGLVMPAYVASSTDQLGTLGLILATTTWLIGFSLILVVASILGRVLAVDPDVHRLLRSLPSIQRWSTRHQLQDEQRQRHDEG